ncbi:cysteine and glycine-rich protein 2-like [Tubulanus polymorphus]|uniref:cysteine and glycine-rich protein 2-like n=1 Tax=Tubulanus polymorphus TaxID=672921 RepID=UPI003DA3F5B4
MPVYGGGPTCAKCNKSVYFNEERKALNKTWHQSCFKCDDCGKTLEGGNSADHDGTPYCIPCHKKKFGAAGYGFGGGGGAGLSTEHGAESTNTQQPARPTQSNPLASKFGGGDKCHRCQTTVYHAECVEAGGKKFHKLCLKCQTCNKLLTPGSIKQHQDGLYCPSCYGKDFGPHGYGFAAGGGTGLSMDGARTAPRDVGAETYVAPKSGGQTTSFGGAEKCFRCGTSVYHAERITGAGQVFHKQCFKCKMCQALLDSNKLAEKDGDIYCKGCYGANFGPKGYGYGGGAGALTRTQ